MARSVALFTSAPLLVSCFYYDSRWGQAAASQKRVAAERTPAELRAASDSNRLERTDEAGRVEQLRIRAYATRHYESAVIDGRESFERALDDANRTFSQDLSFRLELSDYRVWHAPASDDDLSALLGAIEQEDAAVDVDWVVVLASPRPMVATRPDQLGIARCLGRHLVIRAMSDDAEFDAIQQSFDELSEAEKRKLYASRKRHKSASVLLHEVGHTLGLPHELTRLSHMNARYDVHASAFSGLSLHIARHVLELRRSTPGTDPHRNAARAALEALQTASPGTYESGSAKEQAQLLQAMADAESAFVAAQSPRTDAQTTPTSAPAVSNAPAVVSEADRAVLIAAQQAQREGRFAEARRVATELFVRYPDDMAVQELRCQLAMQVGLSMTAERAECDPLRRLSGISLGR